MLPMKFSENSQIQTVVNYSNLNEIGPNNAIEKIDELSKSLIQNSDLHNDFDLLNFVFKKIDSLPDSVLQEECWRILRGEDLSASGLLIIPENDLNNFGNDFWKMIIENKINKLIIKIDGGSIVYEERVIKQLVEKCKDYDLSIFTEMYTIKFGTGEELVETKANLFLCGLYFESLLKLPMEETEIKEIAFSNISWQDGENIYELDITLEDFNSILEEVKTGKNEMDEDVYRILRNYFQYSKWENYPEGAFGPREYDRYFECIIKDAPSVPNELLEIYNGPCPIYEGKLASETHMLYLVPGNWSLKVVEDQSLQTTCKFTISREDVLNGHPEIRPERSYWILKTKQNLPNSYELKTYDRYVEKANEYGYDAPSLLEEAIGEVTWHAFNEEILMLSGHQYVATFCNDQRINDRFFYAIGRSGEKEFEVLVTTGINDIGVVGVKRQQI